MRFAAIAAAARQAKNAMVTHQDKLEQGIDKAGAMVNERTGAKHDDKIAQGTQHLRAGLSKVTGKPSSQSGSAPDQPPPPGPIIDHDPDEPIGSR